MANVTFGFNIEYLKDNLTLPVTAITGDTDYKNQYNTELGSTELLDNIINSVYIVKPEIISAPSTYDCEDGELVLECSEFMPSAGTDTHTVTNLKITKDQAGTDILRQYSITQEQVDTLNTQNASAIISLINIPMSVYLSAGYGQELSCDHIIHNTTYYIFVQFIGMKFGSSEWSDGTPVIFTNNNDQGSSSGGDDTPTPPTPPTPTPNPPVLPNATQYEDYWADKNSSEYVLNNLGTDQYTLSMWFDWDMQGSYPTVSVPIPSGVDRLTVIDWDKNNTYIDTSPENFTAEEVFYLDYTDLATSNGTTVTFTLMDYGHSSNPFNSSDGGVNVMCYLDRITYTENN